MLNRLVLHRGLGSKGAIKFHSAKYIVPKINLQLAPIWPDRCKSKFIFPMAYFRVRHWFVGGLELQGGGRSGVQGGQLGWAEAGWGEWDGLGERIGTRLGGGG